ncbi:MAG: cupin domain-containing protein [Polyangiaceae bacterium]|nr:cupin domain-containing protein [Polyangiaceae bacterium]
MTASRAPQALCNLNDVRLAPARAHNGEGEIRLARVADQATLSGACHFIDVAVLPPGTSIGRHSHARTEEEFYLVLSGQGRMWRDGEAFGVRAGDLVRNPPGSAHGLANTGTEDLRLFVFEVSVP